MRMRLKVLAVLFHPICLESECVEESFIIWMSTHPSYRQRDRNFVCEYVCLRLFASKFVKCEDGEKLFKAVGEVAVEAGKNIG